MKRNTRYPYGSVGCLWEVLLA